MKENAIDILLKDFEPNHTEYQIKNFIIGSEIHPWHQYGQCLREIAGRRGVMLEKRNALKVLDEKIKRLEARRLFKKKSETEKAFGRRVELLTQIAEISRELNCFVKCAIDIRRQYGFEKLSLEQKKILEAEAWREKAKYMLCMDLFCIGRPSRQTVEFVYKLPKKVKRELLTSIDPRNQQAIIEYLVE
jgi:hypothetical protein